jgi:hypothetical protein
MLRLSPLPHVVLILAKYKLNFGKAIINLLSAAPVSNAEFKHSMNKTYTDCYGMQGFTGGHWAYALNTNDTSGVVVDPAGEQLVKQEDRKLACYYLGWESVEVCLFANHYRTYRVEGLMLCIASSSR